MIKLICFNIKSGGKDNHAISVRAPLLKTVLEKYDGDLIGLQEAVPEWMECIERDYGDAYGIFNHYRSKTRPESTPILWKKDRFECLDKGYFWFSDTPDIESYGWDERPHNRICLWVKLRDKKEGTSILFFNTHYGFGAENQVKSSKLVLDHIKAMKADTVLLTADFNMYPDTPGYLKLTEELIDCNAATVKDLRNTFHGYVPEKTKDRKPIDFCFVTPETVTPTAYARMDDLVNGEYPSDHYGIYVELELHEKLRIGTLNLDNTRGPENRTGKLRNVLSMNDVFAVQECNPTLMEKLEKLTDYTHTTGWWDSEEQEATPIFWKKERFELLAEEKLGSKSSLAVLKYRDGVRKFCLVNIHAAEGEQEALVQEIAAKTAPYGEIPVIVAGDFGMQIGSEGYRAMREEYADTRRGTDKNSPTLNALGDEMVPPTICDYIFAKGCKTLAYQVTSTYERKVYTSDHNCVSTTFYME